MRKTWRISVLENPYEATASLARTDPAQFPTNTHWWSNWRVLLGGSFAFPYLLLLVVCVLDQVVRIPVAPGALVAPFVMSPIGVLVALARSNESIAARVMLFLLVLVAYPITFMLLGLALAMTFGFSAT